MKKIIALLSACLLACGLAVTLSGCGGGGTHEDAGTYNLYSLSSGSTSYGNDTVASLGMEDMVVLTLNEDGTGKLEVKGGDTTDLKWSDGTLKKGLSSMDYTLEKGLLSVEIDGQSLVLKKKE